MIRAIREGYSVLRAIGIPITPSKHKLFQWIPEPILVALMRRIFKSKQMSDLIGHAHAARDEMVQIAKEFEALAQKASIPTPAMDRLFQYTDPDIQPVADGSAQIPMKWGGMGLVIGALVVLTIGLITL